MLYVSDNKDGTGFEVIDAEGSHTYSDVLRLQAILISANVTSKHHIKILDNLLIGTVEALYAEGVITDDGRCTLRKRDLRNTRIMEMLYLVAEFYSVSDIRKIIANYKQER